DSIYSKSDEQNHLTREEDIFSSLLFYPFTNENQAEKEVDPFEVSMKEIPEDITPSKSQTSKEKSENESPLRHCLTTELLKTLNDGSSGSCHEGNKGKGNEAGRDVSQFTLENKTKPKETPPTACQTKLNVKAKSFIPGKERAKAYVTEISKHQEEINYLVNDYDPEVKQKKEFTIFGRGMNNLSGVKTYHHGYPIGVYNFQQRNFPYNAYQTQTNPVTNFIQKENKIQNENNFNQLKFIPKEKEEMKSPVQIKIPPEIKFKSADKKTPISNSLTMKSKGSLTSSGKAKVSLPGKEPLEKSAQKKLNKKEKKETTKKKKIEERDGDWNCYKCKNLNFSFRTTCNRCQTSRKETEEYYIKRADEILEVLGQSHDYYGINQMGSVTEDDTTIDG
ncbi:MAG: zinc finger Ran-binding domain-containing protein, partial [archaeon]|nr:zinc finger Ran-binding domain-containing protein [archaeon]